MPDIEIKNLVKLFTVLLLSEDGQSGYDIMKNVGSRLGRKASPGQIYPFLKQLERHGYVTAGERAGRDRQAYYLTADGKKFVRRLSERFGDVFDMVIKPRLTVCAHCSCEIYKGAYVEKIGGRPLSFCCENCARGYRALNR